MSSRGFEQLPRLDPSSYRAGAVVLWTLTIFDRQTGWLDHRFHIEFQKLMFHAAARERLFCPAYCLMPDHLHLVWMGLRGPSDQRNAMAFLRRYLEPRLAPARFQPQAHDHVLRTEERRRNAFARICCYVLENPVRAALVEKSAEWPFSGCILPGYPTLEPFAEDYWKRFWKVYYQVRQPGESEDPANPVRGGDS